MESLMKEIGRIREEEEGNEKYKQFENVANELYEQMETGDEDEVKEAGTEENVSNLIELFKEVVDISTEGEIKEVMGHLTKLKKMQDHYGKESIEEDEMDYNETEEDEKYQDLTVNEKLDMLSEEIPEAEELLENLSGMFSFFYMAIVIWGGETNLVREQTISKIEFWKATNKLFNALKYSREHILMTFITLFGYESEKEALEEEKRFKMEENIKTYIETEFMDTLLKGMSRRENAKELFPLIMSATQIILKEKKKNWKKVIGHPNQENFVHEWIGSFLQMQEEEEDKIGEIVRWNFLREMIEEEEEGK
mmetsp:Transcript_11668/g.17305  ORF Transcript_11668/g.17305 Transcript_11668/m.17305 type:complete len:309 (+) Transcript_11668:19-945(+)